MKWLLSLFNPLKHIIDPVIDIAKGYFSYRRLKIGLETELLTEVVKADVQNRILRKEMLSRDLEWPPFRWLRFFIFFSLVSYYIAVVADSIFLFPFDIAQLPYSVKHLIDEWAGWIIAYFTLMGGQSVYGMISRWLFR